MSRKWFRTATMKAQVHRTTLRPPVHLPVEKIQTHFGTSDPTACGPRITGLRMHHHRRVLALKQSSLMAPQVVHALTSKQCFAALQK